MSGARGCVFEGGEMPNEVVPFWTGIMKLENGNNETPYKELAFYALTCLSTPISNASVERIFSYMAALKQ